jgi:hypothetical protein
MARSTEQVSDDHKNAILTGDFPKVRRLSVLILCFALLSAVFLLLLIFFRIPFPLYPLMSYQDVLDILTPLVLIPIYWLLFTFSGNGESGLAEEMAFMGLAVAWVLGHGMHLSANSVDNLVEALANDRVIDITGTSIYQLTRFFDEHLSHYLFHTGLLGLAGLLIYREWRRPAGITTIWRAALVAGLIYGFTLFSIVLEGQTVPLGLPFATLMVLLTLIWGRKNLARRPLLAFFFVAFLVSLILFAGWGLYWGGFPQFTEVGLI